MKNRNNNKWIDNGQPSKFLEPNDGWGTINSCIW